MTKFFYQMLFKRTLGTTFFLKTWSNPTWSDLCFMIFFVKILTSRFYFSYGLLATCNIFALTILFVALSVEEKSASSTTQFQKDFGCFQHKKMLLQHCNKMDFFLNWKIDSATNLWSIVCKNIFATKWNMIIIFEES